MKRIYNLLTILLFVALYCMSMGFSASVNLVSDPSTSSKHEQHKEQISSAASSQSVHTTPSEIGVSFSLDVHFNNLFDHFDGFGAILHASAQRYLSSLKQSAYLSFNRSIRYRKADLIFPFHNFW